MSESVPGGTNPALVKRGLRFEFSQSEAANLQELHTRRTAEMRGTIFSIFQHLTGLRPGAVNWAIYDVPPRATEHYEPDEDATRQILIIVDATDVTSIPNIHIITNEDYEVGSHDQVLTEDFTLTHDHDAQFFVDATGRGGEEPYDEHTTSSLFWLDNDGNLVVTNYKDFTEDNGLNPWGPDDDPIHPFGLDDYVFDQLDALGAGRGLLDEIASAEPLYWGVQPEIA